MIQIEVENGTTFRRRIFWHPFRIEQPIPMALTAWKNFDLNPGDSTGTVDGDFQIGVQVARVAHGVGYETRSAETGFGDVWTVVLTDGTPSLTRRQSGQGNLDVVNQIAGAESILLKATLYRDYAPLLTALVPQTATQTFLRPDLIYCYSSVPITDGRQPLVLEPVVGRMKLGDRNLRLQLLPSGSTIQWKVNGQPAAAD
jgi:hypothetical protein